MSPSRLLEVEAMLHRVQGWPGPMQLSLATRILQSLEASAARPAAPLKNLLGLLATSEPAPSDEHCESILAEERLRRYG